MSAPADRVPPVAPPPSDVPLTQRVAEILLAAYALDKTVALLAELLAPYRLGRAALAAAVSIASRSAHTPRAVMAALDIDPRSNAAHVSRHAARNDVYYRAAYVVKAAGRIQRSLDQGMSVDDAIKAELPNFEAHREARRRRLDAAGKTALAAETYGALLGWYRNPLLDSDTDCIAADGNNFYAAQSTIIGWPGSVHPNCGCWAGPPHEGGGMVDHVLGTVLGRLSPRAVPAQVLKLKRVAG